MRRLIPLFAALLLAAAVHAGDSGSRAMSGWFNVTSPDGWKGRRYMDGEYVIGEEFDANRDGRIDVWRFYRRGVLTSEERDLNGDGKVDYVSRWDPNTGNLVAVLRDTNRRNVNDVEVEYVGNRRWEVRQDRNLDGITDRIVYVDAGQDLFDRLGLDPATFGDISSAIPREQWTEMWSDDGYSGSITDYFRFRRGVLTHYGEWNGKRIAWRRVPPDYIPPGPSPTVPPPQQQRPQYPDELAGAGDPYGPPPVQPAPPPGRQISPAEDAVRNPFDLRGAQGDYDPYVGMRGQTPPPFGGYGPDDYDPYAEPGYAVPDAPRQPPRPTMTELPKNESFARSVPARMRPPGQSAPRR